MQQSIFDEPRHAMRRASFPALLQMQAAGVVLGAVALVMALLALLLAALR